MEFLTGKFGTSNRFTDERYSDSEICALKLTLGFFDEIMILTQSSDHRQSVRAHSVLWNHSLSSSATSLIRLEEVILTLFSCYDLRNKCDILRPCYMLHPRPHGLKQ